MANWSDFEVHPIGTSDRIMQGARGPGVGLNDDPQAGLRRGYWMAHDGPIHMSNMCDEHVLNAYRTCIWHGNDTKADELLTELEHRDLDWRV